MNKEYRPRDIKYGLVAIDSTEQGEMVTIQHFCGYWNEPGEKEAESLLEELRTDEEFGLTEIADRLIIIMAPDELVQDYVKKIIEDEENNKTAEIILNENETEEVTVIKNIFIDEVVKEEEEVNIGEMINVWIQYHGYLDIDTDERVIVDFYNKIKENEQK